MHVLIDSVSTQNLFWQHCFYMNDPASKAAWTELNWLILWICNQYLFSAHLLADIDKDDR